MTNQSIKTIKIVLATIAVAVVCYLIVIFVGNKIKGDGIKKPSFAQTYFTEKLDRRIDSLKNMQNDRFCRDLYNLINSDIDYYDKENVLDPAVPSNDSLVAAYYKKVTLVAYGNKFYNQAYYIFKNTNWNEKDIDFIRSENDELSSSKYLEPRSPLSNKFDDIKSVLQEYDDLWKFVNECTYLYQNYSIDHKYDQNKDAATIAQSADYLKGNINHKEILNCTNLKIRLEKVNDALFVRHYTYLKRKIGHWSDKYNQYESQPAYSNSLYTPLIQQINAFDNLVYHVDQSAFTNKHNELKELENKDNTRAYYYYSIGKLINSSRMPNSTDYAVNVSYQANSLYEEIDEYLSNPDCQDILDKYGYRLPLNNLKNRLYNEHRDYLNNKINAWKGKYSNYTDLNDYVNKLYNPLNNQLSSFKTLWKSNPNVSSDYNNAKTKLDNDWNSANNYYKQKQLEQEQQKSGKKKKNKKK
ncbi:MAG: hypothetical protein II401_03345 [Bacteroidales bacterium]|nr:hypothetical protein [Bacteroidales bacterium]